MVTSKIGVNLAFVFWMHKITTQDTYIIPYLGIMYFQDIDIHYMANMVLTHIKNDLLYMNMQCQCLWTKHKDIGKMVLHASSRNTHRIVW